MNDTTNPMRRKDDARPAVALQWGDRPDHWTLLLTGPTTGLIGPLGSTWPNQPPDLERVDVCVRRKDGPAAVYRTGGEGAATWHQFYPFHQSEEPLRDGEYLYREGALPALERSEQYRLQMAAISTAAIGYWKLGDSINPAYDTQPLRDVAALYSQYDQLHKFREQVRRMVRLLKDREWAEDLAATGDAADLQSEITEIIGKLTAARNWISTGPHGENCFVSDHHEGDPGNRCNCGKDALQEFLESDGTAPDAANQAQQPSGVQSHQEAAPDEQSDTLHYRIRHVDTTPKIWLSISNEGVLTFGDDVTPRDAAQAIMAEWEKLTGGRQAVDHLPVATVRVFGDTVTLQDARLGILKNLDGAALFAGLSDIQKAQNRAAAETVAFIPPPMVRDALWPEYAVPARGADDGGKPE